MSSAEEVVRQKLVQQDRTDLAELWKQITDTYAEGGPDLVETRLIQRAREIRLKFTKEVKQIETGRTLIRVKKLSKRKR